VELIKNDGSLITYRDGEYFIFSSLMQRKFRIKANSYEDAEFLYLQFIGLMGCLNKIEYEFKHDNWKHLPNGEELLNILTKMWEKGFEFEKNGYLREKSLKILTSQL
jgi:hypothetical protein